MQFDKRPHPKLNPGAAVHGCKSAREALGLARIRLLKRFPLFGIPACKLMMVETDRVPTTAVDARGYLYFNPTWIDTMTVKHLECEVAHEVGHVVTNCFGRFPKGADPGLWNLASDQIIDVNIILPAGIDPSPVMQKMSCPQEIQDAAKKDKLTEVRYRNLLNENMDKTNCPACKNMLKELANGPDGMGDSDGKDKPKHTCGNGRGCISGTLSSMHNLPKEEQAKVTNTWKQAVLKGAQLQKAQGKGNIPGMLEDWVADLVKPKVTWKDYVRASVHRTCNKANWSYHRPSRRGQTLGITLPGRDVELSGVVVAMDTSGSISTKEQNQFISEITGIMTQCRVATVTVIMHDCEVYHVGEYNAKSIRKLPVKKGGTSHVPVFDYIYNEMRASEQPKVLICFTDLETSHHPRRPKFPVLWCVFEDYAGHSIPYGKTISIPERSGW